MLEKPIYISIYKGQSYSLTTQLLTTPFHFTSTPDYFLHPQESSGRDNRGQWYQAPERTAKHLSYDDDSDKRCYAKTGGTCLQSLEHWLVGNGRRGMKQDVSLLAANGNIRCCPISDGVWRCGHILVVLVFW